MTAGSLFLIPASLGGGKPEAVLPQEVLNTARGLRYFIVENAKTARAELKRIGVSHPIQGIDIRELPREPEDADLEVLLAPLVDGICAGLMSEAGAPGVADPGANLVQAAHAKGIRVVPMVGPSSILLALMASGLNGQHFAFHGYLPVREPERGRRIAELERESQRTRQTQIFIETPYRNGSLLASLLKTCKPDTQLCVATELTTERERIETRQISAWLTAPLPEIEKRPTVFLFQAC